MSSSGDESPTPLADRLATACWSGDLLSAKAVLAEGASVNEKGESPWSDAVSPLEAAVFNHHHDVVVWLLSHGADPNGDNVMCFGAYSTVDILQLLIDAGGDVNRNSSTRPPLFWAVLDCNKDKVGVLLAQPVLEVTVALDGKSLEQFARDDDKPHLADMMSEEVSVGSCPVCIS